MEERGVVQQREVRLEPQRHVDVQLAANPRARETGVRGRQASCSEREIDDCSRDVEVGEDCVVHGHSGPAVARVLLVALEKVVAEGKAAHSTETKHKYG
jgi:hypothetical protein